jgi:apolipoprotein N-acyltransferase
MTPAVLTAAAGGLMLSLCFPRASLDFIAWIAFLPLFYALHRALTPRKSALLGLVFGLVFFLLDISWNYHTLTVHGHLSPFLAILVFLGLVLFLSLFPALFCFLLALLTERGIWLVVVGPFLWTAQEFVRSFIFTGFPWDLVGYSQVSHSRLVQISDITGIYGISFLVLLVNCTIWESLRTFFSERRLQWKMILCTSAAVALVITYGTVKIRDFPEPAATDEGFRVGVLQGNIPQEIKWKKTARDFTFRVYEILAQSSVEKGAELLVWPETSVPVLFGGSDPEWKRAFDISANLNVPMLVGAPFGMVRNGKTYYYNSAFLLKAPMVLSRYDKVHLVPFGEYMPLAWLLPLGPGLAAREADYSAGNAVRVMSVNGSPPFSVLICYEAIFPELTRAALRNGARLLVNITNDGWFGETAAPLQHLAMARLRAVEGRVWLIRCANTGISVAVDPTGRLVHRIPLGKRGSFVVSVPHSPTAGSFYSQYGDLFAWMCVVMSLFLSIWAVISDRGRPGRRTRA